MGKEAHFMAIRYKVDIMAELKKKGYSSTKIREEKLIGQSYLQQIRHGEREKETSVAGHSVISGHGSIFCCGRF